jgi:hypothetical protein
VIHVPDTGDRMELTHVQLTQTCQQSASNYPSRCRILHRVASMLSAC